MATRACVPDMPIFFELALFLAPSASSFPFPFFGACVEKFFVGPILLVNTLKIKISQRHGFDYTYRKAVARTGITRCFTHLIIGTIYGFLKK